MLSFVKKFSAIAKIEFLAHPVCAKTLAKPWPSILKHKTALVADAPLICYLWCC